VQLTDVVAGKKLRYGWKYDNNEGMSFATFELFGEGNTTRVKLTHEGFETFPQDNPDFAGESFGRGWTCLIGTSLKEHAEIELSN
jgi:uncharacterized protein YndB with AHSA1/START domain